jgi:uncharacterized membrane protein YdjX (TVP38/TMEM64 family)
MPAMNPPRRRGLVRRLLPVAILAVALALFFAFDLQKYLSFEALGAHRATLLDLVERQYIAVLAAYVLIYALMVAVSVPGGTVLTVAGGFLFGLWAGTLASAAGATIGAALLFLAARHALAEPLRARAGPWFERIERGFRTDGISYLLVLRLIPLFPFFAVNLVVPLLGVKFSTYVATTFVGILPGTFVFTSFGDGLGAIFQAGEMPTLEGVLTPGIVIALIGLAVLALAPVAYRRIRRGRSAG